METAMETAAHSLARPLARTVRFYSIEMMIYTKDHDLCYQNDDFIPKMTVLY